MLQIVGEICSHAGVADLLNLRLVNHLFQKEATKSLWKVHKYIRLASHTRILKLYNLMKKRRELKLVPFPFAAFDVELSLSPEILQQFSRRIGKYILRYSFQASDSWRWRQTCTQIGGKVVMLIAHSRKLNEFHLDSTYEVYVSKRDLVNVAKYFPHLRVIGMKSREHGARDPVGSAHPLIDVLVSRAWNLKEFKIPAALPELFMRNIKYLIENRPQNFPYFALEESQSLIVYSNDTSLIEEFMDMNLIFREISVVVRENPCLEYGMPPVSDEEVKKLVETVSMWLEMQSTSLVSLCVEVNFDLEKGGRLPFPRLPVLKNLIIKFSNKHQPESPIPDMTSYLVFPFPNLTSLQVEISPDLGSEKLYSDVLTYALTHLTQLQNLNLDVTREKRWHYRDRDHDHEHSQKDSSLSFDHWGILTGGAHEAYRNRGPGGFVAGAQEEPVNGIYAVPSLRNMRGDFRVMLYGQ